MKISGPLVIDVSKWDHHLNCQELIDGGVVSVILGLYKIPGTTIMNPNCQRMIDQISASSLILQCYRFYYPEVDPIADCDWFVSAMKGYPVKFAWADLEAFDVAMTTTRRADQNRLFAVRLKTLFPAMGVYTARWYVDAHAPSMNDWLGLYPAWVASYWLPKGSVLINWPEFKATQLPTHEFTPAAGQTNVVGHQFAADRFRLPGVYSELFSPTTVLYGGRMQLDVSVFKPEFMAALVTPPVIVPPPVVPPVIIPPVQGDFMNSLPVVDRSQLGPGADAHHNDCGPASDAMLLRTYNLAMQITVDELYNQLVPAGDVPISASALMRQMQSYGLKTVWYIETKTDQVYGYLRGRRPVLALVHYGALVDAGYTQFKGFRAGHFLVIRGIDLDNYYINDPYRSDGMFNIPVPIAVFEKAWKDCTIDGNPVGGCLVPVLPIQDLAVPPVPVSDLYAIIPSVQAINVRAAPDQNAVWVRTIFKADDPTVRVKAETLTNGYVRLSDLTGWVWFAYLQKA